MDILEKVKEAVISDIEYHTEKISEASRAQPILEKIAYLLQPQIDEEYVDISTNKLKVDFKTTKRAREVVKIFLENTEIEKFEKTMGESLVTLSWHYRAELNGIAILIGPAIPTKKCTPVKKEYSWPYWVCETKKE